MTIDKDVINIVDLKHRCFKSNFRLIWGLEHREYTAGTWPILSLHSGRWYSFSQRSYSLSDSTKILNIKMSTLLLWCQWMISNMRNMWGENEVFLIGVFDKPWASIIIIRVNLELKVLTPVAFTLQVFHFWLVRCKLQMSRL